MNIKSPALSDINNLRVLWKEAFSDSDEFLDTFFSTAFSQNRAFCIEDSGEIISALYFFDCFYRGSKIAYIYAVATKKSHRGKGLCRKLMEHTHSILKALGYKGAILVPGSKSLFEFYSAMGYKTSCFLSKKEFLAQNPATAVKEITPIEYTCLRRKFLPEDGVIQENENIDFLSTYAKFYAGEDFILAGSINDSTLICYELLGNTFKAPFILSALSCEKGSFRTPGSDTPFAMYLSFEGGNSPEYFGFAFD